MDIQFELNQAWEWREKLGLIHSEKVFVGRVFHGVSEGSFEPTICIDCFENHFWVSVHSPPVEIQHFGKVIEFLKKKNALSIVINFRDVKNKLLPSVCAWGEKWIRRWQVREGPFTFIVSFEGGQHPGLFLDQSPLRLWLWKNAKGLQVLNTFSYTGSLSVAAGLGGAARVTSVDLSQASTQWAQENWEVNRLSASNAQFIRGDVFDWFARWKKKGQKFDCIILDPPSFSRSQSRTFSTQKDLGRLHQGAFSILSKNGFLVTSINSAQITREKFNSEVVKAAEVSDKVQDPRVLRVLASINAPETFPRYLGADSVRQQKSEYLKGWIFLVL